MLIVYLAYFFTVGMITALHTLNFVFTAHIYVVTALLVLVLYLIAATYVRSRLR